MTETDWTVHQRTRSLMAECRVPGVVLDVEVLSDVASEVAHRLSEVVVDPTPDGQVTSLGTFYLLGTRQIEAESLGALDVVDRNRLIIVVAAERHPANAAPGEFLGTNGLVVFELDCARSRVRITDNPDLTSPIPVNFLDDLLEFAVTYLTDHGRRRVPWGRALQLLPWLVPIAAVASWIWLAILVPLPTPAHALFLIGALTVFVVAQRWTKESHWYRLQSVRVPGLRIREESRAKTQAGRANRKRDLIVIVITFVSTTAGALLVWYLTEAQAP